MNVTVLRHFLLLVFFICFFSLVRYGNEQLFPAKVAEHSSLKTSLQHPIHASGRQLQEAVSYLEDDPEEPDGYMNATQAELAEEAACQTYFDSYGGVVVYLFGIMYVFIGLAIICEGEFQESIIEISRVMKLPSDVAGATLMAGGTSSPELFTALAAVFSPIDDIGMGTIVGSAIFNILIIIGLCIVLTSYVFYLDWKPIMRDTIVNLLSFIFLLLVFLDGQVHWYESTTGVVLYVLYVAMMAVNTQMMNGMDWIAKKLLELMPFLSICKQTARPGETGEDQTADKLLEDYDGDLSGENGVDMQVISKGDGEMTDETLDAAEEEAQKETASESPLSHSLHADVPFDDEPHQRKEHERPTSVLGWIWFVLACPYEFVFKYTVPPVRGRFPMQYLASFLLSLIWLAILSTCMVNWTEKMGCILGISDAVMGVTFLAIGTSLPDCLTSIFVARGGRGSMAVSNALGSNIFDILLALCLPWVLSAAIHKGQVINVVSPTLYQDVGILCLTLLFFLASLIVVRFRVTAKVGYLYLFIYAIFITYTVLRELGIFNLF